MKAIYPIIMNTSFEKLGMFDDYISFIWTPRYYTPGDFELCLQIDDKSLSWIKYGYYVCREDDENVGIIEDIRIEMDQFGAEMMIVKGRFLAGIIGRRIIAKQTQFNNAKVSTCIHTLLNDSIISPEISARQISNFEWVSYSTSERMTQQFTGQNVLNTISEICQKYDYGFKVTLSDAHKFLFSMYRGANRTYDQSVNPWAVFSDKYDNLLSSQYEEIFSNMVTDVLVAGEGEGLDRKTIWASKDSPTGLGRYEMYKDSRNTRSNDGQIPDEEYYASLEEEGLEQITTYTRVFDGEVDFGNVKFKEDINVGDLCVIENSRWGIRANARLIEVIESVSEAGEYTLNPTFAL